MEEVHGGGASSHRRRDYLRECGGDQPDRPMTTYMAGLPPQVRGRPAPMQAGRAPGGVTPASAGTTAGPRTGRTARWSNPRGRGDDRWPWSGLLRSWELPRERGDDTHRERRGGRRTGTTLAGAGTTITRAIRSSRSWSNPRGRGDDTNCLGVYTRNTEQPLQARGRRAPAGAEEDTGGTTPAGAGATPSSSRWGTMGSSYPRRRGDDNRHGFALDLGREQPPRTRGRRAVGGNGHPGLGATPADAGTT
ncbi:hypothetical protein SGRIM128S_00026 [Streptomyces griseomycini]